ncbi:MAG: DUF4422 domain-containing protein [Lachnospira sp.]
MDTRIYVMTHKEYTKPEDELYRSLHVGKALGNDFGYEGDDTGDNISAKNRNYCELTGMYWLWKNVSCDIVGICHYRRYFVKAEAFLSKDYIEDTLKKYDIIVPHSQCTEYTNLRSHYEGEHYIKDLMLCGDIIREKCPEYEAAFSLCMSCNLFSLGNMVITKKEIFDKYCEWLFDILFEVEKRVDISGYDTFQARIFGYLSERLFRVWLLNQHYRIKEEEVRMIDPKDSDNASKTVALKYRMVNLLLHNIIDNYKRGNYYDVVDNSPLKPELDGKMPVFICWWQGFDNAPELVKLCVRSVEKSIDKTKARIHIITFDNVGQYITLPDWIVDKFNNGRISYTHLSDILRAGLLYRYGGMWIDATYFVASPWDDKIYEPGAFYTVRLQNPEWKSEISQCRWSGNLWISPPGNVLFRFMLNAFYEYWRLQDELVDYYLIDYVISAAYDNICEVKSEIDSCEYSQPEVFTLRKMLCRSFDESKWNEMCQNTSVFKLSYRDAQIKENIVGKETFYGHIYGMDKA